MAILGVVVCVAIIIALIVKGARKADARIKARIAAINARHGLSFSCEPALADSSRRLVFDRSNRKVLLLQDKTEEILEFDYVTSWTPEWNIRHDGKTTDHRIAISTVDVNRPRLLIRIWSLQETKDWVARLNAILNHS